MTRGCGQPARSVAQSLTSCSATGRTPEEVQKIHERKPLDAITQSPLCSPSRTCPPFRRNRRRAPSVPAPPRTRLALCKNLLGAGSPEIPILCLKPGALIRRGGPGVSDQHGPASVRLGPGFILMGIAKFNQIWHKQFLSNNARQCCCARAYLTDFVIFGKYLALVASLRHSGNRHRISYLDRPSKIACWQSPPRTPRNKSRQIRMSSRRREKSS